MNLKVFTAFSGYDSQCMALDRLHEHNPHFNYELVGWAEIDKYAIQAHNAVYPQWADRNYGDISRIDWQQVPDFDLFTYSSPCQDFSQAGKQAGGTEGSGTRSSLLWECRRAILAKKPKYLLMENVAALVSQKFIRLFNAWQLELESYGYRNFAKVLNAKDYGVPQNRERIFMVSILDESARYEFPRPLPLTLRLKDVLEDKVDERYYLKNVAEIEGLHPTEQEPLNEYEEGVSRCIKAQYMQTSRANFVRHDALAATGVVTPQVLGWVRDKEGNVVKRPVVEVANCVTSGKRDNTQNYVMEPMIGAFRGRNPENPSERARSNGRYKQRLELNENGTSNTLTGVQKDNMVIEPLHTDKDGNALCISTRYAKESTKKLLNNDGACANTVVAVPINTDKEGNARTINCHYQDMNMESIANKGSEGFGYVRTAIVEIEGNLYRIRKLTERECFRLMDVPEAYIDRIQQAGISRSQQYKMAGNSIVVSCMYHIWRRLWIDTHITNLTLF